MNRVRHFTHTDLDALACIVVARKLFPAAHVETYCQPAYVDKELVKYLDLVESGEENALDTMLLITDVCPSPDMCARVEKLAPKFGRVLLVDHHGTSAWVDKYPWSLHDTSGVVCAAKLLFESVVCADDALRDLVEAANARDMWLRSSAYWDRGEKLTLFYKLIGLDSFVSMFVKDPEADQQGWVSEICALLLDKYRGEVESTVHRFIKGAEDFRTDWDEKKFAVLVARDYVSETGWYALQQFPDLDYVAIALPGVDAVSLRARPGGTVVSAIAGSFGGAGHAPAAGFPYSELSKAVIEVTASKLETKPG